MILVFGSLNIDMVMPVGQFPKPGETVLCTTDYLSRPGGKGANQAVAAARAGAKVGMIGMVGDDSFGRRCVNNLKHQGIWASGVGTSERPTGCSMIGIDGQGKNIVITAPGANYDTRADQAPDELFTPKNILLTQFEVSLQEATSVLQRAHARKTVTILNPSPARKIPMEMVRNVDYLIVNEIEALQLAHAIGINTNEPAVIARTIAAAGTGACLITLEDKGVVAAKGAEMYTIGSLQIEPVDTTGAGDTLCGVFAACLHEGMGWLDALHRASVGAGLSCLEIGAQDGMPAMEDIAKNLSRLAPAQKIA